MNNLIRFLLYKLLLIVALLTFFTGCYSQWNDADLFVAQITCSKSRSDILSMSEAVSAKVIRNNDEFLQLQKKWDVIAIRFRESGTIDKVYIANIEGFSLSGNKEKNAPYIALDCSP
ncbi:hypothetical protein [Flocculibacter collagenilyticus]|uniref:hypothetical protein n=1 Tax=Flocculibacter collagenilyticus TaxID=2744479 RepID=UPI0018F5B251|nr:hypothetical protein [Flocculibacter collagenilyticus]